MEFLKYLSIFLSRPRNIFRVSLVKKKERKKGIYQRINRMNEDFMNQTEILFPIPLVISVPGEDPFACPGWRKLFDALNQIKGEDSMEELKVKLANLLHNPNEVKDTQNGMKFSKGPKRENSISLLKLLETNTIEGIPLDRSKYYRNLMDGFEDFTEMLLSMMNDTQIFNKADKN